MNLPEAYVSRIKRDLPDADKYFACMDLPPVKGMRINTLKISPEEFLAGEFLPADGAVPWAAGGFYIKEEKPGKSAAFENGQHNLVYTAGHHFVPSADAHGGFGQLDVGVAKPAPDD